MEVVYEKDPCGGKGNMKLEKILSEAEMKEDRKSVV